MNMTKAKWKIAIEERISKLSNAALFEELLDAVVPDDYDGDFTQHGSFRNEAAQNEMRYRLEKDGWLGGNKYVDCLREKVDNQRASLDHSVLVRADLNRKINMLVNLSKDFLRFVGADKEKMNGKTPYEAKALAVWNAIEETEKD
jgi:hypothetical protein